MTPPARGKLLQKLAEKRGNPVILIGASWRRDTATDLDLDAARAVIALVDELDRPERVSIVLAARGGHVAFADTVSRTFRSLGTELELLVPTLVTGVGGLLALAAAQTFVHPYGGVGAYDAGPLIVDGGALSHDLIDDVPALGGIHYTTDPHLPARLAAGLRERRLARALADRLSGESIDHPHLSQLHLGTSVGLGAAELGEAGIDAQTLDDPDLWALYRATESALGLREPPAPRYTESDLGDEVEFEPAVGLIGALVESAQTSLCFELDTGRPDPDSGRYSGAWNREGS